MEAKHGQLIRKYGTRLALLKFGFTVEFLRLVGRIELEIRRCNKEWESIVSNGF